MEYKITQQLAQAILNYLGNKPYAEVAGLIEGLKVLTPITQDNPEEVEEIKETENTAE